MSLALFIVGLVAALAAYNVHHPLRRPGEVAALTFPSAWWGGELPVHSAVVFTGAALWLVLSGGLDTWLGVVGLALVVMAGSAPIASWRQATRVATMVEHEFGPLTERVSPWRFILPFVFRDAGVTRQPGILRDGERLRADLYRPVKAPSGGPAPILVYVHGGGWVLGFRRWQGRILMRRLVRAGWMCVSIEYRLSPWATWPDHIIDVKRALVWVKRMAPIWGADPTRVVISGNSAGGHLSALAALTPNEVEFQPGFEKEDTSVAALVSWYGVYDLVDRARAWPHGAMRRLWELLVMKQRLHQAPDRFERASPLSHVSDTSPPTLLIHGTLDTIVPIGSARAMWDTFETVAPGRCRLVEIEGAEHSFEVFWSRRAVYAVEAAARWLEATVEGLRSAPAGVDGVEHADVSVEPQTKV
jgi:acetyl esterase/lipase